MYQYDRRMTLPGHIRLLRNDDLNAITRVYPHVPKSPNECPTCGGQSAPNGGTYWDGHEMVKCHCREQWRLFLFLLNAGIGRIYQEYTWEEVEERFERETELWSWIKDFIGKPEAFIRSGIGLFLTGDKGTGKTMLGTMILKRLMAQGVECFFVEFSQAVERFTEGWGDKVRRDWNNRHLYGSEVLMLDDLGKENMGMNRIATDLLDKVLRSRASNGRPTLISANLDLAAIERRYSEYIADLIRESCEMFSLHGDSHREFAFQTRLANARTGVVRPVTLG